ncbi:MAG: sulfatase [Flavobacteriales bacterium]|nr:MAG: sulfatase [Flavobacteriales bacterium]
MTLTISKRYKLLTVFGLVFLILSFITRIVFYIWSFQSIDFSIVNLFKIIGTGLFFDIGTVSFFLLPYALYLLLLPNKFNGSRFDKIITHFSFFVGLLIFIFTAFSEFTFWEEFKTRFNFIAVDYLIYTTEVIGNINESYPIPLLLSIIILVVVSITYFVNKKEIFTKTFQAKSSLKEKLIISSILILVPIFFSLFINNKNAEWSSNRYENELSKAGIYSFFAAFRNNELSYTDFYMTQDISISISEYRKHVIEKTDSLTTKDKYSVQRIIKNDGEEIKPNVIFICIESLSAEFMTRYGNVSNLTPYMDSLSKESITYDNLYATGTRTVRGMEAITLSIPPSPGRSIVKRKNNTGFFNIGTVFKQKGYKNVFFYGGDGYFDNMNQFFGGNGFEIVDRGRGYLMNDKFTSKRTNIEDDEVTFENAWGVCDEDIYRKVIKEADLNYQNQTPFFNFVMTTSNHRPYTYPNNKIDIPSGAGRHGAVKYTDFAINEFIKIAKTKPWFSNTVFVIMADHCASSAGKRELDVAKYHIPAFIYNLNNQPHQDIKKLCSQIDIFPTLFGYFNWTYESQLIGRDISKIGSSDEFALIANYRNLGLLKDNSLMILGDKKSANFYHWNQENNRLTPSKYSPVFLKQTIAYYQSNDYFYQNNYYKLK